MPRNPSGHRCCGWKRFMETAAMAQGTLLPAAWEGGETSCPGEHQQHRAWTAEEHQGCRAQMAQAPSVVGGALCLGPWPCCGADDPEEPLGAPEHQGVPVPRLRSPGLLCLQPPAVPMLAAAVQAVQLVSWPAPNAFGGQHGTPPHCKARGVREGRALGVRGNTWAVSLASGDIWAALPAF